MQLKNSDLPDLRQLNTFVAIVERGGYSAAARQLEISQPSVSQQMKRLEAWIGQPIFVRDGAASKMTPDGEALLVFARAMVAMSGQAYAHFKEAAQGEVVRLGLNETFAMTAVPRVLSLFSDMHANLQLLVETGYDTSQMFAELDDGHLDVVVVKTPLDATRGEVLGRFPLAWMGREAGLRFEEGPVPLVATAAPTAAHDAMLAALAGAGRDWTIRFRSQNLAALDAAVSSGVGVSAAMKGLRTGSAVVLGEGCGLPKLGDVALCLDVARGPRSPAVDAFAQFLRHVIDELDLAGHRDGPAP